MFLFFGDLLAYTRLWLLNDNICWARELLFGASRAEFFDEQVENGWSWKYRDACVSDGQSFLFCYNDTFNDRLWRFSPGKCSWKSYYSPNFTVWSCSFFLYNGAVYFNPNELQKTLDCWRWPRSAKMARFALKIQQWETFEQGINFKNWKSFRIFLGTQ